MGPTNTQGQVFPPHAVLVYAVQFVAEVFAFDVEIEHTSVVHEDGEGSLREGLGGLAENLIQHDFVRLGEAEKFLDVQGKGGWDGLISGQRLSLAWT